MDPARHAGRGRPPGARPTLAAVAGLGALLAVSAPATAAAQGGWTLRWTSPPGCPDEAAVRRSVRGLVRDAPDGGLAFRGELTRGTGEYRLVLVSSADGAETGRRLFVAPSCDELAAAAAIVIALAIDPSAEVGAPPDAADPDGQRADGPPADEADAATQDAREGSDGLGAALPEPAPPDAAPLAPEPAGAPGGTAPQDTAPPAAAEDATGGGDAPADTPPEDGATAAAAGGDGDAAADAAPAAETGDDAPPAGWLVQAGGVLDLGPLPGPSVGPALGAAVRFAAWGGSLEARLDVRFQPASSAPVPDVPGGRADFRLLAATVGLCVDAWGRGAWSTGGCLEADLGALWGEAQGLSDPDVGAAFWVAPALGGFLRVRPTPWLGLRLAAAIGLAAGPRRFVAFTGDPGDTVQVHEADRWVGRVSLVAEWWIGGTRR